MLKSVEMAPDNDDDAGTQHMIHGSCLCGAVSFLLDGQLRGVRYCHCANCRKFAGTSPATWAMADACELRVTTSDVQVSRFNSGRGVRCICGCRTSRGGMRYLMISSGISEVRNWGDRSDP